MKHRSGALITTIVLLGVAVSLAAAQGPSPAPSPVRVAYIDVQRVLARSTAGVAAREQLEREKAAMQREMDGKRQDLEKLREANPFPDVKLHEDRYGSASPAIRIDCLMPDSADVSHHPFQGEIDELVDAIRHGRETHLSVFDAQKTMEVCLAADLSAQKGGRPVSLPLIRDRKR